MLKNPNLRQDGQTPHSRRDFLGLLGAGVSALSLQGCASGLFNSGAPRCRTPNVLLILTDDQGYSDVGFNGNPLVKTPFLDHIAEEGAVFDRFYALPVCSPTRASLMTGRCSYRTGVLGTRAPGGMLFPEEYTLAEAFRDCGYSTAIFGKWHMGDCYPMRPLDQGFQESLTHPGGMIGQDNTGQSNPSYFDPLLLHTGKEKSFRGYCNDIYTDAALEFIRGHRDNPFFLYFSTNLPHHPLTAREADAEPYRKMGLSDETSRFYGMIANNDRNIGRLLSEIKSQGLDDDTIVIFMGDNGTSSLLVEEDRYEAGLRGRKTYIYEGGIRVPCAIRWSGRIAPQRRDSIAGVQDVMPTLVEACGIQPPVQPEYDGVSLWPQLTGTASANPDRRIILQWQAHHPPRPYHNIAVIGQRYKLVEAQGRSKALSEGELEIELFDIPKDPGETTNIADQHPDLVESMKADYRRWFQEMKKAHNWQAPDIVVGHLESTVLTWQDLVPGEPEKAIPGFWGVNVEKPGAYSASFELQEMMPFGKQATVHLQIGDKTYEKIAHIEEYEVRFESLNLKAGRARISAWYELDGKMTNARRLIFRRL